MKKKILITLSRVFPQTHSRRGQPTDFGDKLIAGTKIHTIRRNYDLWAVNAEKMQRGNGAYRLSLRQWSDKPYRSKQTEICFTDVPIGVEKIRIEYKHDTDEITSQIKGEAMDPERLAKNDGLSLEDFKDWFVGDNRYKSDCVFDGVVIHFTQFRYVRE